MSAGADWHQKAERGSLLGMRLTAWLYRYAGRGLARLLLFPIVGYFYLTDRRARAASLDYLERLYATAEGRRALARPPGQLLVFRHLLEFGIATLDRVGFLLAREGDFELSVEGRELLAEVVRNGRGALVIGAHLGSFEAMRLAADLRSPLAVNVLMYTRHAERINRLFEELDQGRPGRVRIVPVTPGFAHAIHARACIARGEIVAVLADRMPPHGGDRSIPVKFLGGDVRLPMGPWHLAALLGCPVLSMVGLRVGPRRYRIHVEQVADSLAVPRARRAEALAEHAQAFAERLEGYCKAAPLQWFNFYEYFRK